MAEEVTPAVVAAAGLRTACGGDGVGTAAHVLFLVVAMREVEAEERRFTEEEEKRVTTTVTAGGEVGSL